MDKTKFVFPVAYDFGRDERGVNEGLTMREYFAAKAMQAMIQSPSFEEGGSEVYLKMKCKDALSIADAMIEELYQTEGSAT